MSDRNDSAGGNLTMPIIAAIGIVAVGGGFVLFGGRGGTPEPITEDTDEAEVAPVDSPPPEAAPAAPAAPEGLPAPDDVAAPPANAQREASGLASRVLRPGTGTEHPGPTDRVTVHYTGWRAEDGEMFDSSRTRGQPATFPLNRVIPGWTEGVQLMVVGEQRRFWIPASMAYEGRRGPQGMLVFDVELLSFEASPEPDPVPDDVAGPPASAERTESGLASRVLEAGAGTEHPAETSRVRVHYTGWRAEDGEMFDSSRTRGQPATFPLNRVIPGWTEGLQLMVVGERRRLWIPEELAYRGRPGAPQGMLVFDVELLEILQ
jgi:peptidylprolyl isomerase